MVQQSNVPGGYGFFVHVQRRYEVLFGTSLNYKTVQARCKLWLEEMGLGKAGIPRAV